MSPMWKSKHDFVEFFLSDFNILHFLFSQTLGRRGSGCPALCFHLFLMASSVAYLGLLGGKVSHEGNHLRQGFQKDGCATLGNVIFINSPFPS